MERKRKNKLLYILLILVILGLGAGGVIFWYVESNQTPILTEEEILPVLTVTDSIQSITPRRGGFEYSCPNGDGTCMAAVADAAHPLQWKDELLETLTVEQNTQVSVSFTKEVDTYGVIKWPIDKRTDGEVKEEWGEEIETNETSFLLEPGYIYEIYCSWEKDATNYGRCSWAFMTTGNQEAAANLHPRELSAIKEYLSTYPDDSERLALSDAYVNVHGVIAAGQDRWDEFYQNIEKGTPDEIVLVQYTTEGDAILTYLNYDGHDFYAVEDDTRDGFAGQGEHYREKTFHYLKMYNVTYEDGEDEKYIMLVNDDTLTYEKLENYWMTCSTEEEDPLMASQMLGLISIGRNQEAAALNDAVSNAIMDKNLSKKAGIEHESSDFATQAHIIYYKQDNIEVDNTVTVYAWALYQEYRKGETQSVSGSSMPVAITFEKTNDTYSLVEYWTPKDGSYYTESIDEKFAAVPDYVRERYDIYSGQDYIEELTKACERKAKKFWM